MVSFSGIFDLHTLRGALAKEQGSFPLRALLDRRRDGQAVLRQFDERLPHVVHAKAKVMQAGAVLREPRLERVLGREWLNKLQLRITQIEVREAHSALVNFFTIEYGQPNPVIDRTSVY